MPPLLVVSPEDVQVALRRLRRLSNTGRLRHAERWHPELASLLMETAGDLNHRLQRRLPPKVLRQFTHRVEDLGVLLVEATVVAHVRHWQQHHRLPIPPLSV